MSKSDKSALYIREFLNKESWHSSGNILFEVPKLDARKKDSYPDEATITITDCSRSISLDLGWYDEEELENSLYKLNLLVDGLIKFRKEYINQSERARKIAKKRDKNEKARKLRDLL